MAVLDELKRVCKNHAVAIFSLAMFLCWLFAIRFTTMLFSGDQTTQAINIFNAVTCTALFLFFCITLRRDILKKLPARRTLFLYAFAVCATIASVVGIGRAFSTDTFADAILMPLLMGLFGGIALGLAAYLLIDFSKCLKFPEALSILMVSLILAIVILVGVNVFVDLPLQSIVFSFLPVCSVLTIMAKSRSGGAALSEDGETTNVVPESKRTVSKHEERIFIAKHLKMQRAVLSCYLVMAALLSTYIIGVFPKTANLAPSHTFDFCLGTLNVQSLFSLTCLACLLIVTLAVILKNSSIFSAISFSILIVVLAIVYYLLPSFSTTKLLFVLISSLSLYALFLGLAINGWVFGFDSREARIGPVLAAAGAAIGATIAALFMGPLFDILPERDMLFSTVPAILLIIVILMAAALRQEILRLFFPNSSSLHGSSFELGGDAASVEALIGNKQVVFEILAAKISNYGLTKRELEVLQLLYEGRNEPYIADSLGISKTTVKSHITHIYEKAGVSSRQRLLDFLHSL